MTKTIRGAGVVLLLLAGCGQGSSVDATGDSLKADSSGIAPAPVADQCKVAEDCPLPMMPCVQCWDGSASCPTASCEKGECIYNFHQCPPAPDPGCDPRIVGPSASCPLAADLACKQCADGTEVCPVGICDKDNKCVPVYPECAPATEPECKQDADCPQLDQPCLQCEDPRFMGPMPVYYYVCPESLCVANKCVIKAAECTL